MARRHKPTVPRSPQRGLTIIQFLLLIALLGIVATVLVRILRDSGAAG